MPHAAATITKTELCGELQELFDYYMKIARGTECTPERFYDVIDVVLQAGDPAKTKDQVCAAKSSLLKIKNVEEFLSVLDKAVNSVPLDLLDAERPPGRQFSS